MENYDTSKSFDEVGPEVNCDWTIEDPSVNCSFSAGSYREPAQVGSLIVPMAIGVCLMIAAIVIIILTIRDQNKKK